MPESGAVFESLTGLEYLEMVAALYGIPQNAARARIRQFIAFFDLSFETLTDKLLGAYSKGMRRKVVITSALLHNPPVVFFDEPLDGLDANAAVGFKTLIQTLAREGKTIVYSSHILDVVERVCHRVIIIDKGRLLLDGKPEELGRRARFRHAGKTVHATDRRGGTGTPRRGFCQDLPAMSTADRPTAARFAGAAAYAGKDLAAAVPDVVPARARRARTEQARRAEIRSAKNWRSRCCFTCCSAAWRCCFCSSRCLPWRFICTP